MLKKIATAEVRVGMYLHRMEASWLEQPFWRTRFLLRTHDDVALLHASAVQAVWIDASKGLDVAAGAAEAPQAPQAPAAPVDPSQAPQRAALVRCSFEEAMPEAAQLREHASRVVGHIFDEARLGKVIDTVPCKALVDDVAESLLRHPSALISLARLRSAEDYTYVHSMAVCALMVGLGRQLGLDEASCRSAGLAGLLHDVGKAHISADILNKPGKLTDEEFDIIKAHPEHGHRLLVASGSQVSEVMDVCLHHHEKVDGTGYPHGLRGDDIGLLARMASVCDVYDAVTSERPYKAAWDPADAMAQMVSWQGHFDPDILAAFVKTLGVYPTGALVRMASGRLAVVIEQNAEALTSPVVKVFFSTEKKRALPVQRLDLARPDAGDRIAGREPLGRWHLPQLHGLWAGETALHPS